MHRFQMNGLNMINEIRTAALVGLIVTTFAGCGTRTPRRGVAVGHALRDVSARVADPAVFWNSAAVYFLLTDRFENGDPGNDLALGRAQDGAVLRSYQGGDLAGVLRKLEEGWFDALGVDAIWMTPFVEQNRGSTDEGTGKTYAFHGYWTQDWTGVDPALGTIDDLRAVVDAAHERGIRVLMDAVINHTGPVTPEDPVWPEEWVRTSPRCMFRSYTTTVDCTLVANLPDIRTDSDEPVELPRQLLDKWEREGRLDTELTELDAFFERTGYPRAPRFYIMKWLTDWVRELGFDGYRVDTSKHFEESVSAELKLEAERAFADWKAAHPEKVLDDLPFHMMGEVYNYDAGGGRGFDFGDRVVDFYSYEYDALINFGLKNTPSESLDELYARYSESLRRGDLRGVAILSYISSHDDGSPYDPDRRDPFGAANRLLLTPGGAQIYYGDELARPLRVAGAQGDANLRSVMNWSDLERGGVTVEILEHWRKLGRFRRAHPAIGAGEHRLIEARPYVFSRTLETNELRDRVVIGIDLGTGTVAVPVSDVFAAGTALRDAYSGASAVVRNGRVTLSTESGVVLLSEVR